MSWYCPKFAVCLKSDNNMKLAVIFVRKIYNFHAVDAAQLFYRFKQHLLQESSKLYVTTI